MQRGTMCPPIGIYTNTTHGRAICATITTRSDQRHGNRNDEHQRLGTEPRPNPQSAAYGASRAYVMELLTHYTRNSAEPLLQPHIVQPQRVRDGIYAVLSSQFDRSLPQRLR
jgi:hypothetical protein